MIHLTRDELKGLLLALPNPLHRLAVLVAFWHGLRASELVNLTAADIQDGYLDVQRLKGSLKTIQPFVKHDDPLLDESKPLLELARTLKPTDRIFPFTRFGFYKFMRRAGKRAGLPAHKAHPHALKHSIAIQTIRQIGIEHVRQRLGHKSIASTGEYLRVTDEEASREIARAIKEW